tara:strand:+ start:927 stop:1034 length:108 start_codon:yes stop_codon:yes gene_type:complete
MAVSVYAGILSQINSGSCSLGQIRSIAPNFYLLEI